MKTVSAQEKLFAHTVKYRNRANFDTADNWDSKMEIFLTIIEIISYQRCGVRIELDAIKPMFFVVTCSNRRSKKLFFTAGQLW